jgi:hypothetical protein
MLTVPLFQREGEIMMIAQNMVMAFLVILAGMIPMTTYAEWKPVEGKMLTRWAADVSPEMPWPEDPRPQMARPDWQCLNGHWEYAVEKKNADQPDAWAGKILVPFAIESALSGVGKGVTPDQRLWYRRRFTVPEAWAGRRVLLHFGAVDWETSVRVNGREMGTHRGGYDPFTFDITDALKAGAAQELVVAVWDPADSGTQPRGKQVLDPKGIWYTPVTGIWQSVWLEPVPESAIRDLKLTPDIDAGTLSVSAEVAGGTEGLTITAKALDAGKTVAAADGTADGTLTLKIEDAKLWSPDSPFLYDLEVQLRKGGEAVDDVASYFGMRKISMAKDDEGVNRLLLNNDVLFQFGPLDQGWWPDGLYTPATDEALRYDVEITRKMGFNMARKHVKVEPARWYYHCDRLGLLVWQDMPSGDRYIGREDPDIERSKASEEQFYREWGGIIDAFENHPSIVMWVPFNEGWGQFDTAEVVAWTEKQDPGRLVNEASGWTNRGTGDVRDIHSYPGPAIPPIEEDRAAVLGEFGGLGLPVKGHLWWDKRNWGYRNLKTVEELEEAYEALIFRLRPMIGQGLCAAVYTQTSDVEGEVNGLMTYDRDIVKMDLDRLAAINDKVYLPPPEITVIVPASEKDGILWRYTVDAPGKGWASPDFDDSGWKEGPGVLGTKGTPGAKVRTTWDTRDIWVRRAFDLDAVPEGDIRLLLHHDEDARVYINGVEAVRVKGYVSSYELLKISDEARAALNPGRNLIAIHCRQTGGGQCIDAGLAVCRETD